jgi:hypothetical protein
MDSNGKPPLYQRLEFKDAARATILRVHVDQVCAQIVSGRLTRSEAKKVVARATKELERLIGDDRELFDRIYGSRMQRLIEQFTSPDKGDSFSS